MNIREWICSWLCNSDRNIPSPDIVGEIDYTELYTILKAEFDNCPVLLPDKHYQLATKESFEKFLEVDDTDKYLYTGDLGFDCDNYSEILTGRTSIPKWGTIPIGTVWLTKPAHAINVFVDENKEVWLIEPQNDNMYKLSNEIPYIVWL